MITNMRTLTKMIISYHHRQGLGILNTNKVKDVNNLGHLEITFELQKLILKLKPKLFMF